MPTLLTAVSLVLVLFPLCQFQRQRTTTNNLNESFIAWLNGLFYLPREGDIRIRREYRMLSDSERRAYHRAILLLKNDRSVPPNKYDALASLHHLNTAAGAHGGPGFLGWHRVYCLLFENALREKVPNVTLPYWDNTLDAGLPDPRRAITWSSLFYGNGNGDVTSGPFQRWSTPYGPLRRDIGADRRLMTNQDLQNVFSRRWLWEISNPNAQDSNNLELLHNHVHVWVGQQMSRIEASSFDPPFYSHHAFIDCIWEEFRTRQRLHGIHPGRDYPRIVGDATHQPLVSMGLGRLLMIDGINEMYIRRIYRCERRPRCRMGSNDCGSRYLRCNWTNRQCLPLIMSNRANRPRRRQQRRQQTQRQQQSPWWNRFTNNFNTNRFELFGR